MNTRTNVTAKELQDAFETMLGRRVEYEATHGPFYRPFDPQKVRSSWSIADLTQENAEAWFNGKILTLGAWTGFSGRSTPDAHQVDVRPDAEDETVGNAVNEALSYSRELTLRDLHAEIRSRDRDELMHLYRQWLEEFMTRHGYKTQRVLFARMLHIRLERRNGQLSIFPSNHDRLDGWSGEGLPPDSALVIPADSSSSAIGAALRLAFGRCLDTYGQKNQR